MREQQQQENDHTVYNIFFCRDQPRVFKFLLFNSCFCLFAVCVRVNASEWRRVKRFVCVGKICFFFCVFVSDRRKTCRVKDLIALVYILSNLRVVIVWTIGVFSRTSTKNSSSKVRLVCVCVSQIQRCTASTCH